MARGGRSEYYEMILGIYATLGVFLIIASRNPLAHVSLIWFTIWSRRSTWATCGAMCWRWWWQRCWRR